MSSRPAKSPPVMRWSKDNFIARQRDPSAAPRPPRFEPMKKAPGSLELTSTGWVEVRK